jgi:hypothetical protein
MSPDTRDIFCQKVINDNFKGQWPPGRDIEGTPGLPAPTAEAAVVPAEVASPRAALWAVWAILGRCPYRYYL